MRKTTTRIAAGLTATAAAVTLATALGGSPAQAGFSNSAWTAAGDGFPANAGRYFFDDYGEHLYLYDADKDGAGVYGQYRIGSVTRSVYWGGGAGTEGDFNLSIAEGTKVDIRVCLKDDNVVQWNTCSVWLTAEA